MNWKPRPGFLSKGKQRKNEWAGNFKCWCLQSGRALDPESAVAFVDVDADLNSEKWTKHIL